MTRETRGRIESGDGLAIEYDAGYLARPDSYAISPDAPLQSGILAPTSSTQIGALADAQPDSWGREVIAENLFSEARRSGKRLAGLQGYGRGPAM